MDKGSHDAMNASLGSGRLRGRSEPPTFSLVIMSGSRAHDTWFKRRNGTYALPLAPGSKEPNNLNLMLVQTDENQLSERVHVFSVRRTPPADVVEKTIHLA